MHCISRNNFYPLPSLPTVKFLYWMGLKRNLLELNTFLQNRSFSFFNPSLLASVVIYFFLFTCYISFFPFFRNKILRKILGPESHYYIGNNYSKSWSKFISSSINGHKLHTPKYLSTPFFICFKSIFTSQYLEY